MAASVLKTIPALLKRMEECGVTEDDVERFKEEIDEEDYDLEAIHEDVRHGIQESMLVESFKESYDGKEALYHLLKSILEGTAPPKEYQPKEPSKAETPTEDEPESKEQKVDEEPSESPPQTVAVKEDAVAHQQVDKEEKKQADYDEDEDDLNDEEIDNIKSEADNKYIHRHIRRKLHSLQIQDDKQHADGTVILDPALLDIPYEAISYAFCLENMTGIHYILKYNHAHPTKANRQRLIGRSFITFWKEFLDDEESVTFPMMKEEIANNQGALYDNMMENPPNDRLLPVLEKLVDQLAHPRLLKGVEGDKTKTSDAIEGEREKQVVDFFQQIPLFGAKLSEQQQKKGWAKDLIKTCRLFQKNVDENNYDRYELMITVFDIFNRLSYDYDQALSKELMESFFVDHIRLKKSNFERLRTSFEALHDTEAKPMEKIYIPLHSVRDVKVSSKEKINDDLSVFQAMSCSFLLFVKAFLCKSGNNLERHGHKRKAKKGKKPKEPIHKPLGEVKAESSKKKGSGKQQVSATMQVTDDDVEFWNLNFPLQFDFVIIPKGDPSSKKVQGPLSALGGDKWVSVSAKWSDWEFSKKTVYALYGEMVKMFREMLEKNPKDEEEKESEKDTATLQEDRRDDRYCIVMDRNTDMLYMYPPHIVQYDVDGKASMIEHKKKSQQSKAKKGDDGQDEESKEDKDMVTNRFSLVPCDYNDFINFYLSQQCIIPRSDKASTKPSSAIPLSNFAHAALQGLKPRGNSDAVAISKPSKSSKSSNSETAPKDADPQSVQSVSGFAAMTESRTGHLGVRDLPFVLSAHFHRQKEWHRHPKLRVYQYFNGKGMRFFHTWGYGVNRMEGYDAKRDMVEKWTEYFANPKQCVKKQQIRDLELFDAVLDLYKCDPNFLRWDCAVKRQWHQVEHGQEYQVEAWRAGKPIGILTEMMGLKGRWIMERHDQVEMKKGNDPRDQKVWTMRIGDLYLTLNAKSGVKLEMNKIKKGRKAEWIPPAESAWIFERYYDDRDPIEFSVSIMNVSKRRYLVDLVSTVQSKSSKSKPNLERDRALKKVRHWVVKGKH